MLTCDACNANDHDPELPVLQMTLVAHEPRFKTSAQVGIDLCQTCANRLKLADVKAAIVRLLAPALPTARAVGKPRTHKERA